MTTNEPLDGIEALRRMLTARMAERGASIASAIKTPVSALGDFANGIGELSSDKLIALSQELDAHRVYDPASGMLKAVNRPEPRPLSTYTRDDHVIKPPFVAGVPRPVPPEEAKKLSMRWRAEREARRR